jgi:hypothetical protein
MSLRKEKVVSVSNESPSPEPNSDSSGGVRLKKEVGLFEGVAIIMGIIIGSGKWRSVI